MSSKFISLFILRFLSVRGLFKPRKFRYSAPLAETYPKVCSDLAYFIITTFMNCARLTIFFIYRDIAAFPLAILNFQMNQ